MFFVGAFHKVKHGAPYLCSNMPHLRRKKFMIRFYLLVDFLHNKHMETHMLNYIAIVEQHGEICVELLLLFATKQQALETCSNIFSSSRRFNNAVNLKQVSLHETIFIQLRNCCSVDGNRENKEFEKNLR